jgi:hypothetical protein
MSKQNESDFSFGNTNSDSSTCLCVWGGAVKVKMLDIPISYSIWASEMFVLGKLPLNLS